MYKKYFSLMVMIWVMSPHVFSAKLELFFSDSTKLVPCRVALRHSNGTKYTATDTTIKIGPETWFACDGSLNLDVQSGQIQLRAEKGPEYSCVKMNLDVSTSGLKDTIFLNRWINMSERGYISGENHGHIESEKSAVWGACESLDYSHSTLWWMGHDMYPIPTNTGFTTTHSFGTGQGTSTIWDLELEWSYGAMYTFGLPFQFTEPDDGSSPNLEITRFAYEAGSITCYQGGWSQEVLLDALLGVVHVVNVINNNFHRHRFQPRTMYSNQLDVHGLPDYPGTEEGMMAMNYETYERLLGTGLQLAAGAGTASEYKKTPLGYNRVYVRAEAEEGIEGFMDAWKKGYNFATNGPMIFLRVNGAKPGKILSINQGDSIKVDLDIISDWTVEKAELIINGEHIPLDFSKNQKTLKLSYNTIAHASSYITAYVVCRENLLSPSELAEYENPGQWGQAPAEFRWAYTSPVYALIDQQPVRVQKSISEAEKMLEKIITKFSINTEDADSARARLANPDLIKPTSSNFSFQQKRYIQIQAARNNNGTEFILKGFNFKTESGPYIFNLYDNKGALVKRMTTAFGMNFVKGTCTGKLAKGTYFLIFKTEESMVAEKVVLRQ
ncbi:MAG: hypothetical protein HQK83_18785 [Fibrobacteria bacterium]|nr:hypothetical protein [Fibrobacteria bacterium]